jgi:ABC-type amino acid transport substrate-binding protein
MDTTKTIILTVVVALVVSFVGAKIFSGISGPTGDNLLDTVLRKGEIRAGYVVYPPSLIKDPNTGQLSGIFYDALEEMGKNLGLKINWVEEVGWGTMIEGLKAGRYDIIVTGLWPNSARAKNVDFTSPLYYSAIGVYVRADENRFADLNRINAQNVTIATIDGEMSSFIAQSTFPNAKTLSLPQDTQVAQLLLNITTRKADVTFVETAIAEEFLANNPSSIKNIAKGRPVRYFGNTMAVPKNQDGFKAMINTAIDELFYAGKVSELIKKYEKYPGSFYPVAQPYTLP